MSWIRSAMHRAAEARGGSKFRAAVRTYTDTVVQHAGYSVSEASKMFQDRTVPTDLFPLSSSNPRACYDIFVHSYKYTVELSCSISNAMKGYITVIVIPKAAKTLEEVSVSCKGEERVQLLKRWLVALRDFERLDGGLVDDDGKSYEDPYMSNDKNITPEKPTTILYYDPDLGRSPMNFRDVFLHSQALEGMTMSMNQEEGLRLCLTGGREVHNLVVKSIQDMAEAFSAYDGEMLVRKEELLQFAQGAITGLKVTADIARIDSEISQIQQSLDRMKCQKSAGEGGKNSSEAQSLASLKIEVTSTKEKIVEKGGYTRDSFSESKVHKLKLLLESLHSSVSKTEKRILEHREEKKEVLTFRVARTTDVSQFEKFPNLMLALKIKKICDVHYLANIMVFFMDLEAEISLLEEQRDKLEAELGKVNNTLAVAITRLQNAREERLQFDEDNNEFLLLLKAKEDELSNTIVSYKAEADTCNAFINFLEATWAFQSSYVEQRDKQEQLEPAIAKLKKLWEDLKGYEKTIDPDVEFLQDIRRRVILEQEYMDAEAKVINIFDAVESIKEHFYGAIDDASMEGVKVVGELCGAIEKMKGDFKTIKRPNLRIESPPEEEEPPATASPQGLVLSPGLVMPDFKSIFSQKLMIKSPKQKPYIPLGGLSENHPSSTTENDTKSAESEQHKTKVKESEKPSHPDKDASNLTLEFENETTGQKSRAKSDQGEPEKMSSGLDEESRRQSNGENLLHSNDGIPKVTLAAEAATSEPVLDKTSQLTTGNGKRSVEPDEQPPKSTSRSEEQGKVPTEEVVQKSVKLVNELKDDNLSS
ncbi:hypothetical protein Ccrd_021756 [Cynara cardunculus var. scolymus]|uniref:Uncharacterized protein n=1 Tax=Cynara cardunculus var. scolymus TaxID=59895 RepID=A0A103XZX7_CYNCS|nr:hypothetical protein Ccrd_021756 [Cynara cardunculus var. scolymus]